MFKFWPYNIKASGCAKKRNSGVIALRRFERKSVRAHADVRIDDVQVAKIDSEKIYLADHYVFI